MVQNLLLEKQISETIEVSLEEAKSLLSFFKYNSDRLLDEYAKNPEEVKSIACFKIIDEEKKIED